MSWGAIIAIYFLFWVSAAFLMLPFGVRTDEEMGTAKIPGQADSAPHQFDLARHMWRAAIRRGDVRALLRQLALPVFTPEPDSQLIPG